MPPKPAPKPVVAKSLPTVVKKSVAIPIAEHQRIALLQLLQRPQSAGQIEVYAQSRWQPLDSNAVRDWLTELAGAGFIELVDGGYVLTDKGKAELERLVPSPKREEIPGISEEMYAVLVRRQPQTL